MVFEELVPEELCKGGHEDVTLPSGEVVEKGVVLEADVFKELEVALP